MAVEISHAIRTQKLSRVDALFEADVKSSEVVVIKPTCAISNLRSLINLSIRLLGYQRYVSQQ